MSPDLQVMVTGGPRRRGRFRLGRVEQVAVLTAGAGTNQGHELVDALGRLPNGPVVAEADDQRHHFGVRPAEREVVAVERVRHHLSRRHPYGHTGVVVQQLVQRQRQVSVSRLPRRVERPGGAVGVQHLPEHLDACAVAEKLARREQVAPEPDTVDSRPVAVHLVVALARHDVERLPLRQFLGEPLPNDRAVVVLRPRRPVAAHPFVPAALARLQHLPGNSLLVDDREQLLAHPPGLGLRLDLVAVDHPAAVGVRTVPVAAGHSAGKLLLHRPDDLERADAARGSRTAGAVRKQPDAGPVRGEPPVGRQGHEAIANTGR